MREEADVGGPKVILQMNAKLGGELWGCTTPISTIMVVGIDATLTPARARRVRGWSRLLH